MYFALKVNIVNVCQSQSRLKNLMFTTLGALPINAKTSSKLAFCTLAFCTANNISPSITPASAADPDGSKLVTTICPGVSSCSSTMPNGLCADTKICCPSVKEKPLETNMTWS